MEMPTTFEEAVHFVASQIDVDTVEKPMFHMFGGMSVRNNLGLWDKNSHLHKYMVEHFGLCHADDTGHLITQAAHAKVNGEEYDPAADVQRFKDHWTRLGYDPATMEKL